MSKLLPGIIQRDDNEAESLPQQRLNFSPFFRTAKRKALLIGAITALTTGFFAYQDYKKNPTLKYAGSFQILVEPLTLEEKSSDPNTLINSNGIPNDRLSAIDYPTMLQILRSPDMLSKVVEQIQTEYPGFNISQLNQNLILERVNNSTNRLDASKIIAISYTDKDPKLVQLVLETTAQQYLDYSLNSRKRGIDKGIQFIEKQLPELNREVSQNLDEIQELQERYQIVQADAKGESLLENVRKAESQQRETQKEIKEQTQIVSNLESQLKISTAEAITLSALRENPNYQTLAKRYKDKESDLAIASAKFKANSPQVINLQEEQQKILDLLNSETRQILVDEGVSQRANKLLVLDDQNSILLDLVGQLVEAANRLDTLQARQRAITSNLGQFRSQAQEFPEISRKYKSLQKKRAIANRTKEQLSTQKDKLQIQASQTETPWTIVSQPQVAQDSRGNVQPLPTNSESNVLKGLIGGLFLGIILSVLLEKIRNVFYSLEDVEDVAESTTILGEIPFRKKLLGQKNLSYSQQSSLKDGKVNVNKSSGDPNPIEQTYDTIQFFNAFEQLYANIYLRYRDRAIRSIAVSSASFRDGKSTIALHLAKEIAADGKQVLLVDANSSSYLLVDNSQTNPRINGNLHIFTVPPEALGNSEIRTKMMSDFSSKYEYIIYDVPSILDSVTTGFLSIDTDGILLVTATEKTKKASFAKALEQIKILNLPLLGLVVNHAGGNQLHIPKKPPQIILNRLLKPANSNSASDLKTSFSDLERKIRKDRGAKSSNSN